jgi:hypothetical protein
MFVKRDNNTGFGILSRASITSRLEEMEAREAEAAAQPQTVAETETADPISSVTLSLMGYIKAVHPNYFYNWANLRPEHLIWLNQQYQAYLKGEPQRIEAQEIMNFAGDEALQMNLIIVALLGAKDKYMQAAGGIQNADARKLAEQLAFTCQQLAETVKKAGR